MDNSHLPLHKPHWDWKLIGPQGELKGSVQAVDLRDALSRALTSAGASGKPLGQELNIPVEVLHQAPANLDKNLEIELGGVSISIKQVVCPADSRHPEDIVGCGSTNVSEPDHEDIRDCHECGMFFGPGG